MFSSTVSRDSALVSWKVRTTPSRATWCGDSLPSDWPSNDHVPVSGWSNPVSRLNSVVLPAPFGPIRPVMPPRWISRWSTDDRGEPAEGAGDAVDDDRRVGLGDADLPGEVAQRDLGQPLRDVAAVDRRPGPGR